MNGFSISPKVRGLVERVEYLEEDDITVLDEWDSPNPERPETKVNGTLFIAGETVCNFTLMNRVDCNQNLKESVWFVKCAECGEVSKETACKIISSDGKCTYCRKKTTSFFSKKTLCMHCGISMNAGGNRRKLCMPCDNKRKQGYQVNNRKSSFRGKVISMLRTAKSRSKAKGLDFDLDIDYVMERLESNGYKCEKSGLPLDQSPSEDHEFSVCSKTSLSLDRKNPFKGYTKANTQLVSYHYNVAKNVFSEDDLIRLCKGIIDVHESERQRSQD